MRQPSPSAGPELQEQAAFAPPGMGKTTNAAGKTHNGAAAAATGTTATDPAPGPAGDALDEGFIHRIAPVFKLLRLYSRLEVEGLERIPDGPAILAANHTGWLGLDYAYSALSVYDARKRIVRGMAHKTWFMRPKIAEFARRLGLHAADKDAMKAIVLAGHLVLIFPEGEKGAFKSERERYMLQEFARGYIRVAMDTGVPIVPVAIVGGEEANPSSERIDSYEALLDLSLPTPQNLFPRPVKWRISFLPPVKLEGGPARAADRDAVHAENERIRAILQVEVARLISVRGHPFL